MTKHIKILMGLLFVAAISLGITIYSGDQDDLLPPGTDPEAAVGPSDSDVPGNRVGDGARGAAGEGEVEQPVRVAANPSMSSSGANYRQGVQGHVVDEHGDTIADARLFLMPGMGLESQRIYQKFQQGVRYPPLAQTTSGADGAFKLGIRDWKEGQKYTIRVLHESFCDQHLQNIELQPNDWFDQKVLLKVGIAVFGRVTSEAGVPIHRAKVFAREASGQMNITPAPGREEGKVAETDASGDYEIRNLDPLRTFAMAVVAMNFATEERSELNLSGGKRHQIDFQLTQGLDIGGTVVNPQGKAIRRAKVTVAALSQKSQQTEVVETDAKGHFIASGLRAGMFTVIVEAEGYLSGEEKPVEAGRIDLSITLETTGSVIVTVFDKTGSPLPNFHCNIKAAFEGSETFGNPLISQVVKNAKDGTVELSGIKPMTYVAEIFAKGHAKNFSERFAITAGQVEPPKVVVRLDEGGAIYGVVRNDNGEPVKNVKVETNPNRMIDNPFTKMFQMSFTISQANVTTNAKGEFRFEQLYPGSYQLVLKHDHHCTIFINDVAVQRGQETQVGETRITEGCVVSGIARLDGTPAGQVRVNVSSVAGANNPTPFTAEAVTDNEGKFVLNKRLPPGKYQVMAAQNIQANPLLMFVQFNKSKKEFEIRPGSKHHVLDIRLEKVQ